MPVSEYFTAKRLSITIFISILWSDFSITGRNQYLLALDAELIANGRWESARACTPKILRCAWPHIVVVKSRPHGSICEPTPTKRKEW